MSVNLRTVAEHAGVSVRTVSNVVNGYTHVSAAMRERVQRSIDELGYRPNVAARTLRSGRTGVIGLVVPEVHSPYFGELASAVVRLAAERGWMVHIDQTEGDAERERRLVEGSSSRLVDGLVVSPWALGAADLTARPDDAVPLVMLGERDGAGLVDHVAIDNVGAAREATAHLVATGRRRIAAVGLQPHLANDTARLRLAGFTEAMQAAGLTPAATVEVRALHRADGAAAVAGLLEGSSGAPDAVFCFTDELALGVARALADRGLTVPDDVALVGFDDVEDGRYAVPSLTTVSPDKQAIAAASLQCLDDRLADASTPVRDVVVGHRLLVRESSAPVAT
ncbi:LacI family DNA-binding transcriptional regulator [Solicola sp. PLA-1-18]|uniref:LacI family DNA-binding transcriptional regulator n=1 Tax=Solicola sp. PLA-1-18 TaxID=3380532 RepID=UPI003B7A1C71